MDSLFILAPIVVPFIGGVSLLLLKIREDRTTKTIYIIDEGWAMLNNEFTAKKMFEDARILRGYSYMFIFATQQMGDVLKSDKGEAIMKAGYEIEFALVKESAIGNWKKFRGQFGFTD